MSDDKIHHPDHYNKDGIEVWDIILAFKLNFFTGNVIKYILRAKLKGNYLEDLKKGLEYLTKEIERCEIEE